MDSGSAGDLGVAVEVESFGVGQRFEERRRGVRVRRQIDPGADVDPLVVVPQVLVHGKEHIGWGVVALGEDLGDARVEGPGGGNQLAERLDAGVVVGGESLQGDGIEMINP